MKFRRFKFQLDNIGYLYDESNSAGIPCDVGLHQTPKTQGNMPECSVFCLSLRKCMYDVYVQQVQYSLIV